MDCVVLFDSPAASCKVEADVSQTVLAEPNSATRARMVREPKKGMERRAAVYRRSDSGEGIGMISHHL